MYGHTCTIDHRNVFSMCYIQKMWLGGQTECFQNVGGGKGVYNVLTFQKSRGARAHLGGANAS